VCYVPLNFNGRLRDTQDARSQSCLTGLWAPPLEGLWHLHWCMVCVLLLCQLGTAVAYLLQYVLYTLPYQYVVVQIVLFLWDYTSNTPVQSIVICLLAGKQSLSDLRKFYFRAREDVFQDPKGGVSFNTDVLEEMLKHVVGTEMKMNDVTFPR